MEECRFCNLDDTIIYNKIIEETDNFTIRPALGSLVEGYLLIISKKHINCMAELDENAMNEYIKLIEKYREIFNKFYGKKPIVFEHGTPDINVFCSSCVVHAHTHIVNHNFINETEVYEKLNFEKIDSLYDIEDKNYIFYKNPEGDNFITYNYKPIKQIMRILIARDLGIEEKYNWREETFYDNIQKTLEKFE